MCRLLALRSNGPLRVAGSLVDAPNSLAAQSLRDSRGQAHADGWGVATYDEAGRLSVEKSTQPAHDDPRFAAVARSVAATTLVAHVRQASVGNVSLANTHPFTHGPWVFAHNGTLEGFADRKEPLVAAIPADLREHIAGSTDSEHVFYFWLGKLRAAKGSLDRPTDVTLLTASLQDTVRQLDLWFPADKGQESKFNFVATDGKLLAATRWKHMLSCLVHRGGAIAAQDRAIGDSHNLRAVLIASEPTSGAGWQEIPDRSLVVVDAELNVHSASLA